MSLSAPTRSRCTVFRGTAVGTRATGKVASVAALTTKAATYKSDRDKVAAAQQALNAARADDPLLDGVERD